MDRNTKHTKNVLDYLSVGSANARTARELSQLINADTRTITQEIRRLRLQGHFICANSQKNCKGYFLAESREELERHYRQMRGRALSIFQAMKPIRQHLKQDENQLEIDDFTEQL